MTDFAAAVADDGDDDDDGNANDRNWLKGGFATK